MFREAFAVREKLCKEGEKSMKKSNLKIAARIKVRS